MGSRFGNVWRWWWIAAVVIALAACATTQDAQNEDVSQGGPIVAMDADCDGDGSFDDLSPTYSAEKNNHYLTVNDQNVDWEIYLPSGWGGFWWRLFNGQRLVFFHHGTIDPYDASEPTPALPNHADPIYNQVACNLISSNVGVAWISNVETGYDIEGAFKGTDALVKWMYANMSAPPTHLYEIGFSQGGLIGPMFAESDNHYQTFDAALAICAPLDGFTSQLQYLGDVRALFDYYVQRNYDGTRYTATTNIIPTSNSSQPAFNVPNDSDDLGWEVQLSAVDGVLQFDEIVYPSTTTSTTGSNIPYEVQQALRTYYPDAAYFAQVGRSIDHPSSTGLVPDDSFDILTYSTVQALYYAVRGVNQLMAKAGGQPYENGHVTYTGETVDASALDGNVIAYGPASLAATKYVETYYDTAGSPLSKLWTLHTTEDPAVPFWHTRAYRDSSTGSANLFQQYVRRHGHCAFTESELTTALDQMIRWVEAGFDPFTSANEDATSTVDSVPSVVIDHPTAGTIPGPVDLVATATDDVGVRRVEFTLQPSSGSAVSLGTVSLPDLAGTWTHRWDGQTAADGSVLADGTYDLIARVIEAYPFDPNDPTNEGKSALSTAVTIEIANSGGTANSPPMASFTYTCTDLSCTFDGSGSSDSDGSVAGYAWSYGDGANGSGATSSHTYAASGTYTVTLTVTDDDGATDASSQGVSVTAPVTNSPPTASFDPTCTDLSCTFSDTSTDDDGTVNAWSWEFGDGSTSTAQNPSHTYAAAGTYTVALTVTDDDGATGSTNKTVTVTAPAEILLTIVGTSKRRGDRITELSWSPTTSTGKIDVYRDAVLVATVDDTGSYTDVTTGGSSHTFKVCRSSTSTCSNEATAVY